MSETSSARPSLGPGLLIQRSLQGTLILHLNSHKEHHLFAPSAPMHEFIPVLQWIPILGHDSGTVSITLKKEFWKLLWKFAFYLLLPWTMSRSSLGVASIAANLMLPAMPFFHFGLWMHSLIICFIFAVFEILPWNMVQVCLEDQRCSISPLQLLSLTPM